MALGAPGPSRRQPPFDSLPETFHHPAALRGAKVVGVLCAFLAAAVLCTVVSSDVRPSSAAHAASAIVDVLDSGFPIGALTGGAATGFTDPAGEGEQEDGEMHSAGRPPGSDRSPSYDRPPSVADRFLRRPDLPPRRRSPLA